MYLERLEIQGFKTFAKKTVVEFLPDRKNQHPLTVIVGPNGSGKSNLADAIRWCLGEQSMKQLRGRKGEDIIFSGSKGKARSGLAEVSMTFNNEDRAMKIDYAEVTITRRFYRDGDGGYLLNGKQTRLSDIQLLLAEAGVGQRTYSVIGQGMVDHVLTASPEERKVFFDDATGVRGLQIKRHQSMVKLKKASENLVEVEMLLAEIEPRLRSLKRQVKKLERRESVEVKLRELQLGYFSTIWWNLQDQLAGERARLDKSEAKINTKRAELQAGDDELMKLEKSFSEKTKSSSAVAVAQTDYRKAQQTLADARKAQFEAERELELARVRAQSTWAPLPLADIIKELDTIIKNHDLTATSIVKLIKQLRARLTKPNPDDFKPDPKMTKAIASAKKAVSVAEEQVKAAEQAIDEASRQSTASKTQVFDHGRKLRALQAELHALESAQNEIKIALARTETRIDGVMLELKEDAPELREQICAKAPQHRLSNPDEARAEMLRLKHQLELIGAIDEETVKEYEETEERFTFLDGQLKDIRSAVTSTEKVIDELDSQIKSQSEKAFRAINQEFQKYFKVLFGGGSCSLIKLKETDVEKEAKDDTKVALDRAMEEMAEEKIAEDEETAEAIAARVKKRRDTVAGIDIQATPPGKRLKALNLLSGGERALTSIALLSAIMATNPSPFVVLDEVDAALDEANTVRFANILDELRKLTQFIVITHNRATMERSDLLYGVTMGNDGVSNLISVNITDIEENGTARR